MAKKKRLNKNLVAFLTIMGMILVVSIVGLITWQGAWRDPVTLAQHAAQRADAGDLREAWRLYMKAFGASNEQEPEYLIKASRCMFELGRFGDWRAPLQQAHSKDPTDERLLVALLDGLWSIHEIRGVGIWWEMWRDYGEKLQSVDENNVLGMISLARGLWMLGDIPRAKEADEVAQRAFELKPLDPRVALTYVELLRRNAVAQLDELRRSGSPLAEQDAVNARFREQAREILAAAVAEHPGDAPLVGSYVAYVPNISERIAILEAALAANENSPDLHVELARQLLAQLAVQGAIPFEDWSPEVRTRQAESRERIDQLAKRAAELDPAMYEAYSIRADLQLLAEDGRPVPPEDKHFDAALTELEQAADATATLSNVRAVLTADLLRLRMLRRAFSVGMTYLERSTDPEQRAERLTRAEYFLEDARAKYPDHALTYFTLGECAVAKGDLVAAVREFEKADQKEPQARVWQYWGTGLPAARLAVLYRQLGQYGEAERFADAAIRQYETKLDRPAPVQVVATRAELYMQLAPSGRREDGARQALQFLDDYRAQYGEDRSWLAMRAAALSALEGRQAEAQQTIEIVAGSRDDVATALWRGRLAAIQDDAATAEELLRPVVTNREATDEQVRDALRILVGVMEREEALRYVTKLLQSPPREGLMLALQRAEIQLSEADPDQRDAKLLELVAQIQDPYERALEYFTHYARRDLPQAVPYLETMRKLRPDDLKPAEQEFLVRIELKQYDRAAELLVPLAQYDNGQGWDRAAGATFRGELALARGNADLAIREFRQAVLSLPKSDDLQIKLARAYIVAGRLAEGIDALQRAVEINPRSFDAHRYLRLAYRRREAQCFGAERDKYRELARACETSAAQLRPTHPLVQDWLLQDKEERDPRAAIVERKGELPADPATWSDSTQVGDNIVRIAQLHFKAWSQASAEGEEAEQQLAAEGHAFFDKAIANTTGDVQFNVLQAAVGFCALSGEQEKGEALLRDQLSKQAGRRRIDVQLLLARFYETIRNPEAAERGYQEAQRAVADEIATPLERQSENLRVGLAYIEFYERQRQPDRIIEECRWLLDQVSSADRGQTGDIQQIRLILIEGLLNAGRWQETEAELADYMKTYPEDVRGLTAQAILYRQQNHREDAHASLTAILAQDPEHVWALVTRGTLMLEQGQYDEALADLAKAKEYIARRPQEKVPLHNQLAALYERTERFDLAADELREMLEELERQNAVTARRQQVVQRLVRLLYRRMNQFSNAQELVSEYMAKHPEEAMWPFELARLFESRAETESRTENAQRDYDWAVTYYQQAAESAGERNPAGVVRATTGRIAALRKAGRARDAVAVFQGFPIDQLVARAKPESRDEIRAGVRAEMGVETAKALWVLNEHDAAQTTWGRALSDASVLNIRATRMVAGQLRGAEDENLGPTDAEPLLRRVAEQAGLDTLSGLRLRIVWAEHLSQTGQAATALPILAEVLDSMGPDLPERREAMLVRAQSLDRNGDAEGAIQAYRAVLEANPRDLAAMNNLAYLLVSAENPAAHRPKEALAYAEQLRVMMLEAPNATVLDTVGFVYFENGQLDMAMATLEQAIALDDDSVPAVYLHLARIYEARGRTSDARALLTRGIEKLRGRGDSLEQDYVPQLEEALQKLR